MQQFEIGSTAIPIELSLTEDGLALTGQSPVVSVRRKSDNYFLDFTGYTFKNSGWTNKTKALVEITGVVQLTGKYRLLENLSTAITSPGLYAFEFSWTYGGDTYLSTEEVRFSNAVLNEKATLNKLAVDQVNSQLKLYDDDNTTLLKTWDLVDKDNADIVLTGTGAAIRTPA